MILFPSRTTMYVFFSDVLREKGELPTVFRQTRWSSGNFSSVWTHISEFLHADVTSCLITQQRVENGGPRKPKTHKSPCFFYCSPDARVLSQSRSVKYLSQTSPWETNPIWIGLFALLLSLFSDPPRCFLMKQARLLLVYLLFAYFVSLLYTHAYSALLTTFPVSSFSHT